MKIKTLFIATGLIVLTACHSGKTRIGNYGPQELQKINHVCILDNPKTPNRALIQNLSTSLDKLGISSENVNITENRKRLYEPECRYNLRYSTRTNAISLLVRTPEHPVASLRDNFNQKQDLQKQTDSLISRLFGKTTK
ncbi:hypothetical protein ACM67B_03920 [Neisseria sp. CCUG17229]|uniref:hypothetical protein n=1 Tax=Neisseria sp. CCUG17229 TaxID=3392036 RepID=UPI003A10262D